MADPISKVLKRTGNISITLTGTTPSAFFTLNVDDLDMGESPFLAASDSDYVGIFNVETTIFVKTTGVGANAEDVAVIKSFDSFTRWSGIYSKIKYQNIGGLLNSGTPDIAYLYMGPDSVGTFLGVNKVVPSTSFTTDDIIYRLNNESSATRELLIKYWVTAYGADMLR